MAFPLAIINFINKKDFNMFAIVKTGNKQYRVSKNNTIKVEKIEANEGDEIELDNVLFLEQDDGSILVGKPNLDNVKVKAKVLRNYKDDKVIIFKKRRRKNSRRKNGHRQPLTELEILAIDLN